MSRVGAMHYKFPPMANTYSQVYLHFVFATKFRAGQINEDFRPRMEAYISGIATGEGHHVMALFAMPDHVHLLLSYKITQAIPDFVRKLKASSSKWASGQPGMYKAFAWQEGYGVFSHGPDSLPDVIAYIKNKPEHHQQRSFQYEYIAFLKRFGIDFDERYLFTDLE